MLPFSIQMHESYLNCRLKFNFKTRSKLLRFRCKKSGYFTKQVKNITNRIFICHKQVNNNTKSNSYSLKRQQNYFCNGTFLCMFVDDQKVEHLNDDFYGEGVIQM